MSYEERKRPWGKVRAFMVARCAPATHESDWMSERCLYAHYRKWCFFREDSAIAQDTFRARLDKRHGARVVEVHGHRFYPLVILDADKAVLKKSKLRLAERDTVRGVVIARSDQRFSDGVLAAGTRLTWMDPRSWEHKHLKLSDGTSNSLVVVWNGRRRYLKGDDVKRVD